MRMIRVSRLKWNLFDACGALVYAEITFFFRVEEFPEVTDKLGFDNLFGSDWYDRVEKGKELLEARLSTKDT